MPVPVAEGFMHDDLVSQLNIKSTLTRLIGELDTTVASLTQGWVHSTMSVCSQGISATTTTSKLNHSQLRADLLLLL